MLLRLSIALLSATALAYEVLLVRLFLIAQWHHFAYMIISLALLGFGVSGTVLTVTQSWWRRHWARVYLGSACLFALSLLGCFALAQRLPFNALEVLWNWRQTFYLFGLYLILMIPFFCVACCIGMALTQYHEEIHRLYRYDLLGAGLGALTVIGLLYVVTPVNALRILCGGAFLAATLAACDRRLALRAFVPLSLVVIAVLIAVAWPSSWSTLRYSEFKGLAQVLRVPDTEIVVEKSSPLGQLTIVASPTIPFRHAPGLSLNSTSEPPPQYGLFTDADAMSAIAQFDGNRERLQYLDDMSAALPYHLLDRPHVLILGAGGGADVLTAVYHEATTIDAVELNPQLIRLMQTDLRDFTGDLFTRPEVTIHSGEARGFVARQPQRRFDLVQVSLLDAFNASSAGLYALNESYLYTVEAIQNYLAVLSDDGLVALTRWLRIPPRDSLKLFATALAALEANGVVDPSRHLAMIRSWKTSTLLIKQSPFDTDQIDKMRNFCRARFFDLVYYPGITAPEANRYNRLNSPFFYAGIQKLLGHEAERFLTDYKFHIEPARDNRPYFFHFFKWRSFPEIMALRAQGGIPLLEWAYPILIATLVQASLASWLLIWWPLRRLAPPHGGGLHRFPVLIYFFALGLAFLFIEMASIQRFILFLSHPLYAIAVILAAFLVFAGLGSGFSMRLAQRCDRRLPIGCHRAVSLAVAAIVTLSIFYLFLLPLLFRSLMPLPDSGRILITIGLIAPLAFFMGIPFPVGLSLLAHENRALIPWAWAINGCASVISAVLATLIAIEFGFTVVILSACLLYVVAMAVVYRIGATTPVAG